MTIMTQGNSDGERRCDATCHKAKKAGCVCICGGRYHGKGSSEAGSCSDPESRPQSADAQPPRKTPDRQARRNHVGRSGVGVCRVGRGLWCSWHAQPITVCIRTGVAR